MKNSIINWSTKNKLVLRARLFLRSSGSTFMILIFAFTVSIPCLVQAGWVGEQYWSDEQGNNYQGTVTPPSTPNNTPPLGNTAPQSQQNGPPQKQYDDAYEKGESLYNQGNYGEAALVWYDALQICKSHSLNGCIELETRLISAIAYGDMQETNAVKNQEAAPAAAAAAKRTEQMKRQLEQSKANIKLILEDAVEDYDGTGDIDLAPMETSTQPLSTSSGLKDTPSSSNGHLDSTVVDLRFMDADKLEAPKLLREPERSSERKYSSPDSVLPIGFIERRAMKETAAIIIEAIDEANGNLVLAVAELEIELEQNDARDQRGLEAYYYLRGLQDSEVTYGDKSIKDFRKTSMTYEELLRLPEGDESFVFGEEIEEEPAADSEQVFRNKEILNETFHDVRNWLSTTSTKNSSSYKRVMKNLRKTKTPTAQYAYRYLQGFVAYHEIESRK